MAGKGEKPRLLGLLFPQLPGRGRRANGSRGGWRVTRLRRRALSRGAGWPVLSCPLQTRGRRIGAEEEGGKTENETRATCTPSLLQRKVPGPKLVKLSLPLKFPDSSEQRSQLSGSQPRVSLINTPPSQVPSASLSSLTTTAQEWHLFLLIPLHIHSHWLAALNLGTFGPPRNGCKSLSAPVLRTRE